MSDPDPNNEIIIKLQKKLKECENNFQSLFEKSPDAITISSPNGDLLHINQAALNLFEYNIDEIYSINPSILYYDSNDQSKFQHSIEKHGSVQGLKIKIKTKNDKVKDVITFSTPRLDQSGKLLAYQTILRDITEKKEAELALKESEQRYKGIVETQSEFIVRWRPNGIRTFVNNAYCRYFGITKEQAIGTSFYPLITEEFQEIVQSRLDGITLENPINSGEHEVILSDGSKRWNIWTDRGIFDESGKIIEYQSVGIDITEMKKAEEALQTSERKYRNLVETSRNLIWKCDELGRFTYLNQAWEKTHGYALDEMIGKRFTEFQRPEIAERDMKELAKHLAGGSIINYQTTHITKSGKEIDLVFNAVPIKNDKGEIIGTQGTASDITNQLRTERELIESETKYRSIAEFSQSLIWRCDPDGNFNYLNPAWEKLLGYKLDEMIGRKFTDFKDPNEALKTLNTFLEILKNRTEITGFETEYIHKNGNVVTLLFNAGPLLGASGELLGTQGTAIDITDRLKAEKEIQDSLTRYQILFEATPVGIIITRGTKFILANPAYCKMVGYSEEELIGEDISKFQPPKQAKSMEKCIDRRAKGLDEPTTYESTVFSKDGRLLDIYASVAPINLPDGKATLVFVQDITEQKHSDEELQATREQLFQAQKMEAVGRLAGGIAHDFNNMLTLITLNTEILASQISPNDNRYSYLQNILDAITSSTKLTSELLLFSRNRKMEPEIVDVNKILKKQLITFGPLIAKNIKRVINLDPLVGNIYMDPNHLDQVMMNLIINAADAMPRGGTLTIETNFIPQDYVLFEGHYNTKQLVEISVKDTGNGMTEDVQKRIFEPFFSTKEEGKGTGLGLSTTYHIIKQSNGFIKFDSEVMLGTTIFLYLEKMNPLDLDAQREFEKRSEILDPTDQILLIDDDNKIRSIIKDILTMGGFEVLDTSNAYDALRIFNENKDNINLVISDVVMPDLHGQELVNQISQIKPTVKVLYITGAVKKFESISSSLEENKDILLKPFDSDTLINKLKDLMDK